MATDVQRRGEPGQRQWGGRHEDRSGAVAAPQPQQPAVAADRSAQADWNRPRIDPGRGDGRGDRNSWNQQRSFQQRDDRRFDDRGGFNQPRTVQRRNDNRFDDRGGRGQGWDNARSYDNRGSWNRTGATTTATIGTATAPAIATPIACRAITRRPAGATAIGASRLARRSAGCSGVRITGSRIPYAYRLPEAYGPYRWVRYYNDALLVDIRDGRVVDVVNDIFW